MISCILIDRGRGEPVLFVHVSVWEDAALWLMVLAYSQPQPAGRQQNDHTLYELTVWCTRMFTQQHIRTHAYAHLLRRGPSNKTLFLKLLCSAGVTVQKVRICSHLICSFLLSGFLTANWLFGLLRRLTQQWEDPTCQRLIQRFNISSSWNLKIFLSDLLRRQMARSNKELITSCIAPLSSQWVCESGCCAG